MSTKRERRDEQTRENMEFDEYDRGKMQLIPFVPLTQTQSLLYKTIFRHNIIFAIGPAGTAKSFTAAAAAIRMIAKGDIDKIIITRNPVPTGYTTGFKPGTSQEKMTPWLSPILENLKACCESPNGKFGYFYYLLKNNKIEMMEPESVKGSNFKNTFVIIEESQEMTREQLKNLTTRRGEDSILYFDGDIAQGNERLKGSRDFEEFIKGIEKFNMRLDEGFVEGVTEEDEWANIRVPVIKFEKKDCVRSGECRWFLEMFDDIGI